MNAFLALLALALPTMSLQEPRPAIDGDVLESDMRMEVFHPEHADPNELESLYAGLADPDVTVETPEGRRFQRRVLQVLGSEALLVYERVDRLKDALRLLHRLDEAAAGTPGSAPAPPVSFRPRFVSLDLVERALRPFVKNPSGGVRAETVDEAGLVLLRGDRARIDAAVSFLRELDVPRPQARFRCYLVGPELPPGSVAGNVALPDALAAGLRDLVGEGRLQVHALGILSASLGGDANLSIALQPSEVLEYVLAFRPTAYDAEQGVLAIENCRVVTRLRGDEPKEVLQTQLSLHAGEYTVLGASGTMPRYVVLYFEPLPR